MGVDLYAGPLCRWYARDFVTPALALVPPEKRMVIDAQTGKVELHRPKNPAKYRDAILGWMQEIRPRLRQAGPMVVKWEELPRTEYLCEQYRSWPHIRCFAAYAQTGELKPPSDLPSSNAPDAAFEIARELGLAAPYASLIFSTMWLPLDFERPIVLALPTGQNQPVGSVAGLRSEAESLAAEHLGVSPVTPETLGQLNADQSRSPLERAAADAVWRILKITDFALANKLPVVVDY